MANPDAPTAGLEQALAHTARLLAASPALAAAQAREILKAVPGQREALLLLGRAQGMLGETAAGAATLRRLTQGNAADAAAWRALAELLFVGGDAKGADAAHQGAVKAAITDPMLMEAAMALREGRLAEAEPALRGRLKSEPTDVAAIRMLAEVAAQIGRYQDAVNLLSRALELAPSFQEARHAYVQVLLRHERPEEALVEAERLLASEPANPAYGLLKAAVLVRLGDQAAASGLYADALGRFPNNPKGWMSYGHVLKTVGKAGDGIEAYRKSLEQTPELGEAWWSLANLKTFRFEEADIATMRGQLARADLDDDDRLHLHFALGKALEDGLHFGEAFGEYAKGNAIRRGQLRYRAEDTSAHVARAKALYTPAFFAERTGQGCQARDPIFIVGLPRSGSTLVEQILSSHSQVEGTAELPDITTLVRRLAGNPVRPRDGDDDAPDAGSLYPGVVASLSPEQLAALGQEYLDRTRVQRRTDRPMFIDKLPNNWMHVGLIQLILPGAVIIDARRHPMGCCLSGFKQHFARGQGFTYDLGDIGRYYRDYVGLMAHYDAVLPGRVHRVIYERMIADTEGEVRRLLDHAGLAFEPACLSFWTNERAVRTASSEQVRQPIFGEAVDHWKNFEPWLGPLEAALGPVLEAYPDAPAGI
ncbi:MAG: sulfotransferase [Caulobacter sp.]|nr:sulfotransferase [Caulobacter sp.]